METVPRSKVDVLAAAMKREGVNKGILIGGRLAKGARMEIARLKGQGIEIEYKPISNVLYPVVQTERLLKNDTLSFFGKALSLERDIETLVPEVDFGCQSWSLSVPAKRPSRSSCPTCCCHIRGHEAQRTGIRALHPLPGCVSHPRSIPQRTIFHRSGYTPNR